MIDVKQATQKAFDYLDLVYENISLYNILLEEAEFNGTSWFITLSFDVPNGDGQLYKIFKILGSTGKVEYMKIGPLPEYESLQYGKSLR